MILSILSLYTLLPLPGNTCVSKLPICVFFYFPRWYYDKCNEQGTKQVTWVGQSTIFVYEMTSVRSIIEFSIESLTSSFSKVFFMYELSFCIICIICIIVCYGEVKEILGAFVFALSCPDLIPVLELLWLRYEGNKSFQMIIQFPQFSTRSPLQQGRVIQG